MKSIKMLSADKVLELLPYEVSKGELQDILVSEIAHVFVSEDADIGDILIEGAHFEPSEGGYIYTGMHMIVPQTTNEQLVKEVSKYLESKEEV